MQRSTAVVTSIVQKVEAKVMANDRDIAFRGTSAAVNKADAITRAML